MGDLFGGGGAGGGGDSTVIQSNEPWEHAKFYLKGTGLPNKDFPGVYPAAAELYLGGLQPWLDRTVAPVRPETLLGIQRQHDYLYGPEFQGLQALTMGGVNRLANALNPAYNPALSEAMMAGQGASTFLSSLNRGPDYSHLYSAFGLNPTAGPQSLRPISPTPTVPTYPLDYSGFGPPTRTRDRSISEFGLPTQAITLDPARFGPPLQVTDQELSGFGPPTQATTASNPVLGGLRGSERIDAIQRFREHSDRIARGNFAQTGGVRGTGDQVAGRVGTTFTPSQRGRTAGLGGTIGQLTGGIGDALSPAQQWRTGALQAISDRIANRVGAGLTPGEEEQVGTIQGIRDQIAREIGFTALPEFPGIRDLIPTSPWPGTPPPSTQTPRTLPEGAAPPNLAVPPSNVTRPYVQTPSYGVQPYFPSTFGPTPALGLPQPNIRTPTSRTPNYGVGPILPGGAGAGRNIDRAINRLVSGQVNTGPFYGAVRAAQERTLEGLQDAQDIAGESFRRDVLPAIRQEFQTSGTLGGSRHQLATARAGERFAQEQRLAQQRANRELADIATTMYAPAYQQAQTLAAQTTGDISGLRGNLGLGYQELAERGRAARFAELAGMEQLKEQARQADLSSGLGLGELGLGLQRLQTDTGLGYQQLAEQGRRARVAEELQFQDLQERARSGDRDAQLQYARILEGIRSNQAAEGLRGAQTAYGLLEPATRTGFQQVGAGILQAPQAAGMAMQPHQFVQGLGDFYRQLDQENLANEIRKFNELQFLPWQNLEQFTGILHANPNYSETRTTGRGVTPGGGSMAGNILGGGLIGGALGHAATPYLSSLMANTVNPIGAGAALGPYGVIGGALLGAGLGLLG